ncbi:MAG TPA: hypothetical protein VMM35_04250 [Longimicrobiales bacterium]|nr:hypothetical protein [Longimicrobiales bacterium]
MSEGPPIVGKHPDPSEEEERPDGVILFDPTPRQTFEIEELEEEPRRLHPALILLVLGLAAAGGFQLYQSRTSTETQVVEAPAPPSVDPMPMDSTRPELAAVGGTFLAGTVGSTVNLEVRATGTAGIPIADTLVRFQIVEGTGEVQSAGRTDADGVATSMLRLPLRAGTVVVEAVVPASDLLARFRVAAQPGAPSRMEPVGGNEQAAEVGELLSVRPSVRVLDAAGNPVPGADVRISAASGGGVAAPTRTRTDSLGMASWAWRLGMEPGEQELAIASIELPETVTFTAQARGRPVVTQDGTVIARAAAPPRVQPDRFAIGGSHTCALEGGTVVCRGTNDSGQAGSGVGSGFVALAVGNAHTCALDDEGVAMCWGLNDGGQLGDGSRTDRASPTLVRTDLRFELLTAGTRHTCGLTSGGLAVCWGENLSGQLGDGSRTDARFPRAVGGGLTFSTLVAGWSHTCGLTSNGNAFCWGLNSDGQLGDASTLDRLVPTLVRGALSSLAAGSSHTCGLSDTEVLCWGSNRFGQLGDGTNESRPQPVTVQGLPGTPRGVTAGAVHACALLADGSAYCWGQNLHGQLGDGTTQNRNRATRVAGDITFQSLEAGGALTCGFTTDGTEYCWGFNQNGQLGDGTRESRPTPTAIP